MRCPFLTETQVRFCRVSPAPKVILRIAAASAIAEKCSSPAYGTCVAYRPGPPGERGAKCPYLEVSPARYCSAVAERRPIPQSAAPSDCESACYRYCAAYCDKFGAGAEAPVIEGLRVPVDLAYAGNHVWFDLAEDGWCHAGIDAFLTKLLGRIERVTTFPGRGTMGPSAVLQAHKLDWHVTLPGPMPPDAIANLRLRAHPECLTADPYGGWLFAGRVDAAAAGLIRGEQAIEWMRRELERLARLLGGRPFEEGLLGRLDRDEALSLFQEFCV